MNGNFMDKNFFVPPVMQNGRMFLQKQPEPQTLIVRLSQELGEDVKWQQVSTDEGAFIALLFPTSVWELDKSCKLQRIEK